MLDHNTLQTFIYVASTQSFAHAAKALHRSVATISYRIKTLEEKVGTPLFVRTTRSVQLTPAGEYLLEKCKQWQVWLESMPRELQQISQNVETHVDIVVNNLLYQPVAVSRLLCLLQSRFPFTQFKVSQQVFMGVWDSLLHRQYHFAIGVPGTESLQNTISTLSLGEIQWQFVVNQNHPLAKEERVLTNDQLRVYPAINIEDTALQLAKRVAWRLAGQHEIIVPDLQTKLACHLQGVGIGFLPLPLCQPYLVSGELIAKTVYYPRPNSPLSLAWYRNNQGKVIDYLLNLFEQKDAVIMPFYPSYT